MKETGSTSNFPSDPTLLASLAIFKEEPHDLKESGSSIDEDELSREAECRGVTFRLDVAPKLCG